VLCEKCLDGDRLAIPLPLGVLEYLKRFLTWQPDKISRLKISPEDRERIGNILRRYIRFILEKDLKSAAFVNTFSK
jgi:hypothetical protein